MILVPMGGGGTENKGQNECLRGFTHGQDKLGVVLLVLLGSARVFVERRDNTKRGKRCFL